MVYSKYAVSGNGTEHPLICISAMCKVLLASTISGQCHICHSLSGMFVRPMDTAPILIERCWENTFLIPTKSRVQYGLVSFMTTQCFCAVSRGTLHMAQRNTSQVSYSVLQHSDTLTESAEGNGQEKGIHTWET
eukprot:1015973-Pelagomonas_calceolata.AAC.2